VTDVATSDDHGERIDRLARDGVSALVGAAVTAVLNLLLVLLVIHLAGKTTAGVVFAATSLFLIVETAARLGAPTGLMYFVVRARTLDHVETVRDVLRAGLLPVVVAGVLVGAVCFVVAAPVGEWMAGDRPAAVPGAVRSLQVLAVLVPFAAISDSLLYSGRAFGTMRPLVLGDRIGRPILQVVLTVAVIAAGWRGAPILCAAWGVPYVVTAVLGVVWTVRLVRQTEAQANVTPVTGTPPWVDFWKFTTPRGLQNLVQIALQRFGIVLVSAILGPPQAAVFAAVTRFLVFGQLGQQAITAAVQPQLGATLAKGDKEGASRLYQVSTCWLVLLCWPIYLALAVFSGQVPKIFGHGYDAGTSVLLVLAFAMLFATGVGMVDAVLAMAGRTAWTFMNTTLALVLDVVLSVILLPHIGLVAAAVAWAAAIVANNLLPLLQLEIAYRLHPFGHGTLLAMAAAAGWLGVLPLAVVLVAGSALPVLVAAFGVGLLGYGGTVWRRRSVFDLDALRRAVRRRGPAPVSA
jgi:O-antigen/teichoic acid export membrane protein